MRHLAVQTCANCGYHDLYSYDPLANSWADLNDATTGPLPPPRYLQVIQSP